MSFDQNSSRRPSSRLAELASRIKQSTGIKGKIIEIPHERFVCQNKIHGKIKTVHSFAKEKEITCDCGLIYKKI